MISHDPTVPTMAGCPTRETLRGFALATISEDEIETIGGHLEKCSRCEAVLSEFDDLCDSFVQYLRDYDEPLCHEDGYRQLHERMQEQTAQNDGHTLPVGSDLSLPRPEPLSPQADQVLGNYRLVEKLGQGAMGVVYRAWHTKLKRTVAVKLLAPRRLDDPHVIERFAREMEALGKLDDHPHVIRARDAGEVDGQHYLVTEYVDGLDLGLLLLHTGPLSVPDACEVARQAALGLAHAHRHGLVHRDVKPSNLMLTRSGTVQVLDLGLASFRGQDAVDGAIVGTADYMAPEQWIDGAELDMSVDIYGLGCTLYKLLVGHAPFSKSAVSSHAKRRAHQKSPAPKVGQARPDVPDELEQLIQRMLAKRPSRRPATAREIADTLEPLAKDADLRGLAATVLGDRDDTLRHMPDATLAQRILGPLTLVKSTRRRWLAAVVAVPPLIAGLVWVASSKSRAAPFELLFSCEPGLLRWEYDSNVDGLESRATSLALYQLKSDVPNRFTLSTEIVCLDRHVEAGLFFDYVETPVGENLSRGFQSVAIRKGETQGTLEVIRTLHSVFSDGTRTGWRPKPIASIEVPSTSKDHLNRLSIVVDSGRLDKITLDGQEINALVEADPVVPYTIPKSAPGGVFSNDGVAFFGRTRLDDL